MSLRRIFSVALLAGGASVAFLSVPQAQEEYSQSQVSNSIDTSLRVGSNFDDVLTQDLQEIGYRLSPSFQNAPDPRVPDWREGTPYATKGMAYSDEDIKKAIKGGVDFILNEQNEDGSWDVVLTGASLLGETADDAVDAIIATSLAGLALRAHAGVDQERIHEALRKAVIFVADRVTRGKLPTRVWYACWRYAFGIKFIANEYRYVPESDESLRERLELVAARMRESLIKMQLIDHGKSFSEGDPLPASFGIRVAAPTMDDYTGGAKVESLEEGSRIADAQAGSLGKIQPGDRIFKIGKRLVENAFDFYTIEAEAVEDKAYEIYVRRDGVVGKARVFLKSTWPADLGVEVANTGDDSGVRVTAFRRGSAMKREGMQVGDVIDRIGTSPVTSKEGFEEAVSKLAVWKKAKVRAKRGKKSQYFNAELRPRPSVNLGFIENDEDKNDENGVEVLAFPENPRTGEIVSPAASAGLRESDFVTHINGIQVLGVDHFIDLKAKLPGYTPVTLKVLRGSDEVEITYTAGGSPMAGWLGIKFNEDYEKANPNEWAIIGEIVKGHGADSTKIRVGDRIVGIAGEGVPNLGMRFIDHPLSQIYGEIQVAQWLLRGVAAGDVLEIEVMPKADPNRDIVKYEVEATIAPTDEVLAEGGWAYYPKGVAPSFTTAATLLFFLDCEESMGKEIRLPKKSEKAAINAVKGMKAVDKKTRADVFVYDQRTDEDLVQGRKDPGALK
ncbi:MAG: PDZ domain-containing protein, partial [Planctomycetes bacterium]|nr:PDZ domain-containing protein [Planctomycetota bacterium]